MKFVLVLAFAILTIVVAKPPPPRRSSESNSEENPKHKPHHHKHHGHHEHHGHHGQPRSTSPAPITEGGVTTAGEPDDSTPLPEITTGLAEFVTTDAAIDRITAGKVSSNSINSDATPGFIATSV